MTRTRPALEYARKDAVSGPAWESPATRTPRSWIGGGVETWTTRTNGTARHSRQSSGNVCYKTCNRSRERIGFRSHPRMTANFVCGQSFLQSFLRSAAEQPRRWREQPANHFFSNIYIPLENYFWVWSVWGKSFWFWVLGFGFRKKSGIYLWYIYMI